MYGTNPIMKIQSASDGSLDVHSIFYTIQGEGPHAGRAAVFVRLHGCSLACSWCDTEFDDSKTTLTPAALMAEVIKASLGPRADTIHQPIIVITGGEPMRQDLAPFVEHARDMDWEIQIETAGIHGLSNRLLYYIGGKVNIVCSPKLAGVHPTIAGHALAFKYIVDARQEQGFMDGLPLFAVSQRGQRNISVLARPNWLKREPHRVYVQPLDPPPSTTVQIEGETRQSHDRAAWRQENLERCIWLVKTYGYRLSIQQHKIIGVE